MKQDDNYCGFLCSDIMERQESICNDIKDFAEYNPEFAKEMIFKLIKLEAETLSAIQLAYDRQRIIQK